MPKYYRRAGRPPHPKQTDPAKVLHATSVRLTQPQIDFLREEAVKRNYFSYKYPGMGAVSTMITDLVEQFFVFVHGQPKKKKKYTVK